MSDQVTEPGAEPQTAVQLQIADILLAAQIISLASQRGAFRAEEFTQVGGCYDRLTAFLKDSGALTPPEGESTADTAVA
jgi:hypothetical protein